MTGWLLAIVRVSPTFRRISLLKTGNKHHQQVVRNFLVACFQYVGRKRRQFDRVELTIGSIDCMPGGFAQCEYQLGKCCFFSVAHVISSIRVA